MIRRYTERDHTFAICAYKESKYLIKCIESLKRQSIRTNIIVVTSTPSTFLEEICHKYGLKLYVNKKAVGNSSLASDWNYALKCAGTELVTITHQDDIYKRDFAKQTLKCMNKAHRPLIAFTDYSEFRSGAEVVRSKNLNIKRLMLFPFLVKRAGSSVFVRRRILSLGSAICCPSVTYAVNNLMKPVFSNEYESDLDWQAWERISREEGEFVYIDKILMVHRIHKNSETTRIINSGRRYKEDYEMFCRLWPKRIARFLMHFYWKSYEQNRLEN